MTHHAAPSAVTSIQSFSDPHTNSELTLTYSYFVKQNEKYLFCLLDASSQGTDIGYLLQPTAYHNE